MGVTKHQNLNIRTPSNYSRLDMYIENICIAGKVMECTLGPMGLEIISLNCGAPSGEKRNLPFSDLFQFFAAGGAIMIKT